MKTMPLSKDHFTAIAFHERLAQIDISAVPVMSLDRHQPRKEQARQCRELFRRLGLKGISVTAPNYSMAQSVDVRLPGREDYVFGVGGMVQANDPARNANSEAQQRIRAILLAAFPKHDDRSDAQSDHFDYRWSVS